MIAEAICFTYKYMLDSMKSVDLYVCNAAI